MSSRSTAPARRRDPPAAAPPTRVRSMTGTGAGPVGRPRDEASEWRAPPRQARLGGQGERSAVRREHPRAQQREVHHPGDGLRGDQHTEVHRPALDAERRQRRERPAGQGQAERERHPRLRVLPAAATVRLHPEAEPAVREGVGVDGEGQRDEVGDLLPEARAQQQVEGQVGPGREAADQEEPGRLPAQDVACGSSGSGGHRRRRHGDEPRRGGRGRPVRRLGAGCGPRVPGRSQPPRD